MSAHNAHRIRLRTRPRRAFVVRLTLPFGAEALGFALWVERNQGRTVTLPLWHIRRHALAAVVADTQMDIDNLDRFFIAAMQPEGGTVGLYGNNLWDGTGTVLVFDETNGWQRLEVLAMSGSTLTLAEPLARPISARAAVYPAITGVIRQAVRASHEAGRVLDITLDADAPPPAWDWLANDGTGNAWQPLASYESLPVLACNVPGNDWGSAHEGEFDARLEAFDTAIAPVRITRVNTHGGTRWPRRLWAKGATEIAWLRGLLDYLRGRLYPVWLDEQIDGLELASPASAGDDRLTVARRLLPAWMDGTTWLWARKPGAPFVVKAAGAVGVDAETAHLMLAEPLADDLPAATRLTRLLHARLDHDAVDLIWHTDDLLEVNLTFAAIPFYKPVNSVGGY